VLYVEREIGDLIDHQDHGEIESVRYPQLVVDVRIPTGQITDHNGRVNQRRKNTRGNLTGSGVQVSAFDDESVGLRSRLDDEVENLVGSIALLAAIVPDPADDEGLKALVFHVDIIAEHRDV